MRLLSFLSDIELAFIAGQSTSKAEVWQAMRTVNYENRLARLTLAPRESNRTSSRTCSIFLQAFALADGSMCVKASLSWSGSDDSVQFSVYATPELDWKRQATEIASALRAGPRAGQVASSLGHTEQIAAAG